MATATTNTRSSSDPQAVDFKTIKLLGKGSFGQVWLAQHKPTSTLICLKAVADPDAGGASAQEVATLSQLNHVNIVRYLGSFRLGGGGGGSSLVICMEYADGGDLADRIKEAAWTQAFFSEREVLRWFGQLCLGLQHMHALRILHRDLKPQNVLLRRHPLGDRLLIGDVGIAKELSHTLDHAHTAIGTPQYLAPEVFQSQPYSFSADVWSLGCLLFEMTNLAPPFSGKSLNDLSVRVCTGRAAPMRSGVSTALADLIWDILQVNPARRPSVLALLQSPLAAPHVQEYAAEVLAEDDGRIPTEHDTDGPGRAELRRQLEECGLQPAAPSASGLVDRAREAEREQRLLGVLARLRRERDARLLRLAGGGGQGPAYPEQQGQDLQEEVAAGMAASTSSSTVGTSTDPARATTLRAGSLLAAAAAAAVEAAADATHAHTPPGSPSDGSSADPPAPVPAPASPSPSSPLTTLAERVRATRAFLGGTLGEVSLRRADELAAAAAAEPGGGGAEQQEARLLASEVFAGGKGKYVGVFLHVRALEARGQAGRPWGREMGSY